MGQFFNGRRAIVFAVVLIVIANLSVVLWDSELRQSTERTITEALRDKTSTGFQHRSFVDDHGVHSYTVFAPHKKTTEPRPAIVFLNGFGENGDDGVMPLLNGLAHRIRKTSAHFPFVAIFPQCGKGESWTANGSACNRTLKLLGQLTAEYDIDPSRIHLTGLSSGGQGVWNMTAGSPDRFASLFPVSASGVSQEALKVVEDVGTPVFTFHNRFDTDSTAQSHSAIHSRLVRAGNESGFVDVGANNVPHNQHNAWDFGFGDAGLFSWLLRQSQDSKSVHKVETLPRLSTDDDSLSSLGCFSVDSELRLELMPTDDAPVELFAMRDDENGGGAIVWQFHLISPDQGCCHLKDIVAGDVQATQLAAALSLRKSQWNDLRVIRRNGRLTIRLNEWTLAEAADSPSNNVSVFLKESGNFKIQNSRGHGLETANNRVAPLTTHDEEQATESKATVEEVVSTWQQRQQASEGLTLRWRISRERDNQWSEFQAAVPREGRSQHQIQIGRNATLLIRPWNYPMAGFQPEVFQHGLMRNQHQRWMIAFRTGNTTPVAASDSHLRFTPNSREETIVPTDGSPSRQIVSTRVTAKPGIDSPEELFDRIPQLIYQPFAVHGFDIDPSSLELLPKMALANGIECVVLQNQHEDGTIDRYFMSPKDNFAVVKFVQRRSDATADVVTIDYKQDPTLGIVPRGWTLACTRSRDPFSNTIYPGVNSVVHFGTAVVEDVASHSDFPTSKAHEIIVHDQLKNTWFRRFSDGRVETMQSDDIQELRDADSGLSTDRSSFQQWIVVAIFCLLMFLIGRRMLNWRNYRTREHSE